MSIQSILERKGAKVFTIEPTATVRTAAQLIQMHGIAALVVIPFPYQRDLDM